MFLYDFFISSILFSILYWAYTKLVMKKDDEPDYGLKHQRIVPEESLVYNVNEEQDVVRNSDSDIPRSMSEMLTKGMDMFQRFATNFNR